MQLCEKEKRNMDRFARTVEKYFEERTSTGAFNLKREMEILVKEVQKDEERLQTANKDISLTEQRLAGLREENRKLRQALVDEEANVRRGNQVLQGLQQTRQRDCERLQVLLL